MEEGGGYFQVRISPDLILNMLIFLINSQLCEHHIPIVYDQNPSINGLSQIRYLFSSLQSSFHVNNFCRTIQMTRIQ